MLTSQRVCFASIQKKTPHCCGVFWLLKHKLKLKKTDLSQWVRRVLFKKRSKEHRKNLFPGLNSTQACARWEALLFLSSPHSSQWPDFRVLRHSKSLGTVFIFMKRQSLQAQCPVRPATNDLSGSSRFKRCIMPVSVRIIKVLDGLSRRKETIFSVLQTSSCKSRTVCTHSG